MKIASLETGIVLLPNDEPLAGFSENPNAKNPIVWLKLRTDDGIEGLGVTYFGGALTRTLRHAVDELGALVGRRGPAAGRGGRPQIARRRRLVRPGRHPDDGDVGDRRRAVGHQGQGARPAVMEAARRRARPHPHLCRGALRRGLKLDEAVTAAGRLREKGYRQTKMQLGLPGVTTPAREVEQARLIREAVGPDMDLMCDINQRWRPEQAIDIGKRVAGCRGRAVLAGGRDGARRLRRPRAGRRRAGDAGRRRRVSLGHRAVPPHDGSALGRHPDDRPGALAAASPRGSRSPAWPKPSTCRWSATACRKSTSTWSAPCRTG